MITNSVDSSAVGADQIFSYAADVNIEMFLKSTQHPILQKKNPMN